MPITWVNERPDTDLGLQLVKLEGHATGYHVVRDAAEIAGALGAIPSPLGRGQVRRIPFVFCLADVTEANRMDALETVLRLVLGGLVEVRFADSPTSFVEGIFEVAGAAGSFGDDAAWLNPEIDVRLDLVCYNPVRNGLDWQPQVLDQTPRRVALGSLPSNWRALIFGSASPPVTNPSIIVRAISGEPLWTLPLVATLDEGTKVLEVVSHRGLVRLHDDGDVSVVTETAIPPGSGAFLRPLDGRRGGIYAELSEGEGVLFWRRAAA